MPKYPWRVYSPLRTHDFDDGVQLKGREPGELYICRKCLRRFKFDSLGRVTWAVAKDREYSALETSISNRWISEQCAQAPGPADEEDSRRVRRRVA
jgi:hypothetical protein